MTEYDFFHCIDTFIDTHAATLADIRDVFTIIGFLFAVHLVGGGLVYAWRNRK